MSEKADQLRETIERRKVEIIAAQAVKDKTRREMIYCEDSSLDHPAMVRAFEEARTKLSDLNVQLEYDLSALRRMELFS